MTGILIRAVLVGLGDTCLISRSCDLCAKGFTRLLSVRLFGYAPGVCTPAPGTSSGARCLLMGRVGDMTGVHTPLSGTMSEARVLVARLSVFSRRAAIALSDWALADG